jgi:hypothetical protein
MIGAVVSSCSTMYIATTVCHLAYYGNAISMSVSLLSIHALYDVPLHRVVFSPRRTCEAVLGADAMMGNAVAVATAQAAQPIRINVLVTLDWPNMQD